MSQPPRVRAHPLAPRIQRVIELLRQRPGSTIAEIAEAVDRAPDTVRDYVSQAVRQGFVGVTFAYGATRYHVRPQFTPAPPSLSPAHQLAIQLTMVLDELDEDILAALQDAIKATQRARRITP